MLTAEQVQAIERYAVSGFVPSGSVVMTCTATTSPRLRQSSREIEQ